MLRRLYDDPSLKDVTFQLDSGSQFSAHRCILKVSSVDFFTTYLQSDFKEATATVIEIKDCSDDQFEIIVQWAYEIVDNRKAMADVFAAADRFLAPSLIKHYADFIIRGDDAAYVEFLFEAMKYPLSFQDIMKTISAKNIADLWYVLKFERYIDHVEEILLFMVKNYIFDTQQAKDFLNQWLNPQIIPDKMFKKSALDMRDLTIILLQKAQFIKPADIGTIFFKRHCKRLIEKGYYRQSEIDSLYNDDYKPFLVISSYPLKIGKLIPIDKALDGNQKVLFMYSTDTKDKIKTYFPQMGTYGGYYNVIEV